MRETEAKDLKFTRHFLKRRHFKPQHEEETGKIRGKETSRRLSCDSIEVLWSTELPVTQITQQANSKSKTKETN